MKISCVIPTRNRPTRLRATLRSLAGQPGAPEEIIVVDGSDDAEETARLQAEFAPRFPRFRAVRAEQTGAAIQRNQGVALAAGEWIGFCDDDLDFEPGCLQALRAFLAERSEFGGVSATITNQAPRGFGRATRAVVGLMDAHRERPLDGRVIGPALNFLPAVRAGAPAVCEAEWLNTTCTIYRRAVLPAPPFDAEFQGYSMLEDVCLSARVAARTRLAVLRDARVFHDTQPGSHKRDPGAVARMNVRNRFYVATRVLGRPPLQTWMQLAFWQTFSAVAGLRQARHGWLKPNCGAAAALVTIALGKK
ncbi:MAG TPA: glycosyltransferase family 2 protein [Trebonia sp.]|nr:glycosyltransferase family 2 protein [Trebonia sp.]